LGIRGGVLLMRHLFYGDFAQAMLKSPYKSKRSVPPEKASPKFGQSAKLTEGMSNRYLSEMTEKVQQAGFGSRHIRGSLPKVTLAH